ncbi:hypothetical protein PanWU01x14_353900 [Parasponia andersonii]|uniref:Uncharacterized protein n=1 Tax=Parasponia andersonii TaxID=3476 RepID=A0A2P5A9T1_PARAD|nr:hypothetical protein PanWU01x14_353900 [Parasponia andersonii]
MRNQRLREESRVKSEVETPPRAVEDGGDRRSKRRSKRRLIVPLRRRAVSVTKEIKETLIRVFHGREGAEGGYWWAEEFAILLLGVGVSAYLRNYGRI